MSTAKNILAAKQKVAAPATSPETPAREPQATDAGEALRYCPVCSTLLEQHRCKLRCTSCGYYMSCSDYY